MRHKVCGSQSWTDWTADVDAGMGEHGAGKGLGLPGDGHCLAAVGVGDDVHGMLPGWGSAALLASARCAARRSRAPCQQPLVELRNSLSSAREASGDPFLLFGALLGITYSRTSRFFTHLVQVNLVVRPGLDGGGPFGVERRVRSRLTTRYAVALSRNQATLSSVAIPASITTRASAGACRVLTLEHLVPAVSGLRRPCRQHFGAAHETRTSSTSRVSSAQALLFRVPALCLGLVFGLAFEKRVGECRTRRHRVTQPQRTRHLRTGASRWPPGCGASDTR